VDTVVISGRVGLGGNLAFPVALKAKQEGAMPDTVTRRDQCRPSFRGCSAGSSRSCN